MALKAKQRLIQHLLSRKEEEGFTLVELIVVVMIIGILSSIAIPSFMNAGDKAKQNEVSMLLASYVKAAQAFFAEYGELPKRTSDIGQYVTIPARGCIDYRFSECQEIIDLSRSSSNAWYTASGLYSIRMSFEGYNQRPNYILIFTAAPVGDYESTGYGATACYNPINGITLIKKSEKKGKYPDRSRCWGF